MSGNSNNNASSQLPLNLKLFHISRDLHGEETLKLKFLLKDLIPKTSLAADVEARRLFQCLEDRDMIRESNPRFLVQCLFLIGRENLVSKYFPNHDNRTKTDHLSSFRLKLYDVATGLKHRDKDEILNIFSKEIPRGKAEEIKSAYDLLAYFEERTFITDTDTTRLQKALEEVGRIDLANNLVRYHGGTPLEDSNNCAQACSSMPSLFSGNKTDDSTEGKMTAATLKLLSKATESVGRIGGGTGFRVGSKYIMTASHVVKGALGFQELTPVTCEQIQTQLDKQGLDITFTSTENLKPIPLLKIVAYSDCHEKFEGDNFDVTIAELAPDYDLPEPLLNFYDNHGTDTQQKFYFLGHDGCKDLEIGFSWTLVDGPNLREIAKDLDQRGSVKQSDVPFFNKIGKDHRRVQLQGPFRQGGSGSPGVIIRGKKVKVFTILTHGRFHDFHDVPENRHIQEGTRMWYLKEMLKQDKVLREDIFRGWDTPSREESSMDVV